MISRRTRKYLNFLIMPTPTRKYQPVTDQAPLLDQLKQADLTETAIFSGAGVDPDGLASMLAMSMIVSKLGGNPTGFYKGTFNRPQNRTMQQVLGLQPKPMKHFKAEDYTCVISVDGPSGVCPVVPNFIIDHHNQGEPASIGNDVRLQGSCASILWEYAQAAEIDWGTEDGARLATAIAVGIKTDTKDGSEESTSDLDYEALSFCLRHKDNKLYKEILNYPRPAYYIDMLVLGWENKRIEGTVLVTGLGIIPKARSGVISDLAEKYLEQDGISTAIVFAQVEGNIDISVRSNNSSLNVDEFVKAAFGCGGGKRGAGRAYMAIPLFAGLPDDIAERLCASIYEAVVHKALMYAGDGVTRSSGNDADSRS